MIFYVWIATITREDKDPDYCVFESKEKAVNWIIQFHTSSIKIEDVDDEDGWNFDEDDGWEIELYRHLVN